MKFFTIFITLFFINIFNVNANNNFIAKQEVIKSITKLNYLSTMRASNNVVRKFINNEILTLFDFDYMAHIILDDMPNSNFKQKLIIDIKNDIINTILQKLSKAKGRYFMPVGVNYTANGNLVVGLLIGNKIRIELIMHNLKNKWKIFDIRLGRDSLLAYYKKVMFK